MSSTLYCGYYPEKCNDIEILPYLSCDMSNLEWHGRHVDKKFYDNCRELSTHVESKDCFIFTDRNNLFEFAAKQETPTDMSDYITENFKENFIFIIWVL